MFVYFFNIILICVYAIPFLFVGEKTTLKKAFFIIVCFAQCYAISAMRFNVGTDYAMYYAGFKEMAQTGFSQLKYEDWEIGYVLFNKIVGLFTDKPSVMFAFASVLSLVGPFRMIWKYSKKPILSVMIFLNTHMFYMTFNFVRQAIAISILCFAYGFLKDRKIWQFLLICAVAATFHATALYMVPVFFVTWVKLNLKTLPIYAAATVIYFVFADMLINWVLSFMHKEYADSKFIRLGVYWHYAIYPVAISIAFIALAFYLKFKLPKSLNMLTHLVLLMGFWQIVMTKHAIVERFSYYSMIFLLIAIPEAIDAFKEAYTQRKTEKLSADSGGKADARTTAAVRKSAGKAVVIVTSLVMAATIAYNLQCLIVPKKGAHGTLPFQTLYNLDIPNIDSWFKG